MTKPEHVCHEINSRNCPACQWERDNPKPKEFWINPNTGYISERNGVEYEVDMKWQKRNGKQFERIHVIEYKAYQKAIKALKLYAMTNESFPEDGDVARKVLKELGEDYE